MSFPFISRRAEVRAFFVCMMKFHLPVFCTAVFRAQQHFRRISNPEAVWKRCGSGAEAVQTEAVSQKPGADTLSPCQLVQSREPRRHSQSSGGGGGGGGFIDQAKRNEA